jgi:hypothetical protein
MHRHAAEPNDASDRLEPRTLVFLGTPPPAHACCGSLHVGPRNMRAVLSILLLFSSCDSAPHKVETVAPPEASSESPAVVALNHFSKSAKPLLPKSAITKSILLVLPEYMDSKGLISDGSFKLALGDDEEDLVPEELRLDIERRTGAGRAVATTDLPLSARLVDFERSPHFKDHAEFQRLYPDAKSWVALWPTGLTSDRKQALVVFLYGDLAPGWRAVYLLERRGDHWEIVRHYFPASN